MACRIKQFEWFFSKVVKLDENESQDSKRSDLKWFDEIFKIIMFNMLLCASIIVWSFLKLFLNQFWCIVTHFKAYDLLYKNMK